MCSDGHCFGSSLLLCLPLVPGSREWDRGTRRMLPSADCCKEYSWGEYGLPSGSRRLCKGKGIHSIVQRICGGLMSREFGQSIVPRNLAKALCGTCTVTLPTLDPMYWHTSWTGNLQPTMQNMICTVIWPTRVELLLPSGLPHKIKYDSPIFKNKEIIYSSISEHLKTTTPRIKY